MKPVVRDEQIVLGAGTKFAESKDLKHQFGTDFWRSWYRFNTVFYLHIPVS
ncbi:hypothetical protein HanHA89_Chr15g0619471 [Helianthus annuus]|nr:hypothetical protein HanHA89_Chr15g0619471 [Helianthus annuus]